MTKETILKKAIEKAEKNGYTGFAKMLPIPVFPSKDEVTRKERAERIVGVMMKAKQNDIIFSHDFAKAFWGKGWVCTGCGEPTEFNEAEAGICEHNRSILGEEKAFEYHLQQMVLEKDPIKYLERFLEI